VAAGSPFADPFGGLQEKSQPKGFLINTGFTSD